MLNLFIVMTFRGRKVYLIQDLSQLKLQKNNYLNTYVILQTLPPKIPSPVNGYP